MQRKGILIDDNVSKDNPFYHKVVSREQRSKTVLNTDSLSKLFLVHRENQDVLKFLKNSIDSFEEYHRAVFDEQLFPVIFRNGAMDADEYRDQCMALDRKRTVHHNSVIANVSILNRMAQNAGLPPIYDGVVSEEHPYRREVADAVFAFIEGIINNRT